VLKKLCCFIGKYPWLKYAFWGILAIGVLFLIIGLISGKSFSFIFGLVLTTISGLVLLLIKKGWAGLKIGGLTFATLWIIFHLRNSEWKLALWWVGFLIVVLLVSSFISMLSSKQSIGKKLKGSLKYVIPVIIVGFVWHNWGYIKDTPNRWKKSVSSSSEKSNIKTGTGTIKNSVTDTNSSGNSTSSSGITNTPPVAPLPPPPSVLSSDQQSQQIANAYLKAAEASQQAAELNSRVSMAQLKAMEKKIEEKRPEEIRNEAYKKSREVKRLKELEPFILD
jgi:hypothetical protein